MNIYNVYVPRNAIVPIKKTRVQEARARGRAGRNTGNRKYRMNRTHVQEKHMAASREKACVATLKS